MEGTPLALKQLTLVLHTDCHMMVERKLVSGMDFGREMDIVDEVRYVKASFFLALLTLFYKVSFYSTTFF